MKYFIIFVCCILIILLFSVHYNTNIIEGAPQLPSGTDQAQINTISDMRTFLEQMYMVCLLNPNDQEERNIRNTNCYKINILASYLWPALGPYAQLTLDDISPIFGAPNKPTSVIEESASQQNPNPPPIPIILNDIDYQLFLQLAIIGDIIQPFATAPHNNWNSVVVWFKQTSDYARDACAEQWGGYQGATSLITLYLEEIKTILAHFHSQTDSSSKLYEGDNEYTKLY